MTRINPITQRRLRVVYGIAAGTAFGTALCAFLSARLPATLPTATVKNGYIELQDTENRVRILRLNESYIAPVDQVTKLHLTPDGKQLVAEARLTVGIRDNLYIQADREIVWDVQTGARLSETPLAH